MVSHILREPERWALLAEVAFCWKPMFELISYRKPSSAGHLVETPGGDRLPHPPRGRLRVGPRAGGRPLQGVRGSHRGQQRAAPHRARCNEASAKGASAEAGSHVWRWILQDGNSGCSAVDIHPWGAGIPVQVHIIICTIQVDQLQP